MVNSAFKEQEGGAHYKDFKIQPIEFITQNNLNWWDGSIVKYACRHKNKGGSLDLKKVIHYARLELEVMYGVTSSVKYDDVKTKVKRKYRRKNIKVEEQKETTTTTDA